MRQWLRSLKPWLHFCPFTFLKAILWTKMLWFSLTTMQFSPPSFLEGRTMTLSDWLWTKPLCGRIVWVSCFGMNEIRVPPMWLMDLRGAFLKVTWAKSFQRLLWKKLFPVSSTCAWKGTMGIRIMHLSELDGKVFNSCWRIRNPIWPLVEDFLQEILFVLSLWPKLVQICTFAGSWKPASWMPMSSFKRKKFACDFDFSDVVTCGVAVTLYGQTCIYIYAYYIHYICVYICVCVARGKYLFCGFEFVYWLFCRVR